MMINYWVFHLLLAVLFLPWLPCFKCDSDGSMVFVKDVVTDEETSVVEDFSDGMSEHELFVPSEVWQKVKPGQALPSGLHYRINLQTGEKEAKLLDGNDHNVESGGKTDADTTTEGWKDKTGKFNFMTEEQLKTKFASLPDDGPKGLNSNEPYNPDLSQYKSMEELKRDFEALNAQIQTESEIVTDLVSDLKTFDHSSDILLTKLEDLSFYMHQIDNAQDFVLKMDGLDLIRTFLNHTHSQVRQSALKVLTACLQANQRLKVFAIENGQVLNLLTQTLTSEQNSEDAIVAKSALYSLSALLRNFPFAQKLFADINGFDLLCRLVHKGVLPSTKVLQLKTDLIMEARTCLDQKDDTDLMKQYQLTAIWNKVGCACDMITSDLETAQQNINSLAKIDSLLDAVRFLRMSCPPEEQRIWSSVGGILLKVLQEDFKLKMENMGQSGDNESLEYQGEIIEKLSQVLLSLEKTFPERDEL